MAKEMVFAKLIVESMRRKMQEYVDESDIHVNLKLKDGNTFAVPEEVVVALFNDLLLFSNDGDQLDKEVVSHEPK